MNRLWSLKTWSGVLLVATLSLGLFSMLAVHRLYQRAADLQQQIERTAATSPGERGVEASGTAAVLSPDMEFRLWTGGLAVLTTVAAILLVLHRRHIERFFIHPMKRLAGYLDRVALGERFLQLPSQKEPVLNRLVSSGNVLIERFNRYVEESQRTGSSAREQAQAIIETFSDIALLVNEAGEPVMTNQAVSTLPRASDVNELATALKVVLSGDDQQIELAGRTFIVIEALPAETRGFSGTLLLLREKARENKA